MILFVFEGDHEDDFFASIQDLFFPKEADSFVCVYGSNIYSLYAKMKRLDIINGVEGADTVSILNEILAAQGNTALAEIESAQVSQIYLFFDYDFHHNRGTLEDNNSHLQELIEYFDEETDKGKLYINYPMLESIRYTKELPDDEYVNYTIPRSDCIRFKGISSDFSFYPSIDYLTLSNNSKESEEKKQTRAVQAKRNWEYLIDMNVMKANFICHSELAYPKVKSDIGQMCIFKSQLGKYVYTDKCEVSILNSFPIFLYEYLK